MKDLAIIVGLTVMGAAAGVVSGGTITSALAAYGPLGLIAGYLMLRLRELDRAAREERKQAWRAVAQLRAELTKRQDEMIQYLAEIATRLEKGGGRGG